MKNDVIALQDGIKYIELNREVTIAYEEGVIMVTINGQRYGYVKYPVDSWTKLENCIPNTYKDIDDIMAFIKYTANVEVPQHECNQ